MEQESFGVCVGGRTNGRARALFFSTREFPGGSGMIRTENVGGWVAEWARGGRRIADALFEWAFGKLSEILVCV